MTKFFEEIKSKINNKFYPEKLELIDNSYLHTTHKSFDPKKIHLKIIIKSDQLKKMNKIDAYKAIHSVLKEEMSNKIHALEIKIK